MKTKYVRYLKSMQHRMRINFLYDTLQYYCKNVGDKEGPKVYISGHMDEVGFMVTQITEKGFLKFQTVGGWWGQVMLVTSSD